MAPQSTAVRGGVVALAVHKPRGHASERIGAGDGADLRDAMGRPSVYGLVPRDLRRPSLTAVGRLDVETSGLILFTDSAGLSAAIRGGRRVQKAYVATVSGAGLSDGDLARAAESMRAPLSRTDPPEEGEQDGYAWTSPAKVRVTRRWRLQGDDGAEDGAERSPGAPFVDHPSALRAWREARRVALGIDERWEAAMDGGAGGMVADFDIMLREGRYHHVRRLVKRAGLRMRHLRRVAIGPVSLGGIEVPGQARVLSEAELGRLLLEAGEEGGGAKDAPDGCSWPDLSPT